MDRGPLFTSEVRAFLGHASVKPVRLPARSPILNAFAERFILSIKTACLSKLIVFGEGYLRVAVRHYVAH